MFYTPNFMQNADMILKLSENTYKVLIVLAVLLFKLKNYIFTYILCTIIKNSNKVTIYVKFCVEFRYDT